MNEKTGLVRNDYIDYLRGILILLVVYGHTIQYFGYSNDKAFFDDPVFKIIYIFHMPLFMAVSGFVSFKSIKRKPVLKSISDRFYQLIVPILCLSIVFISFEYFKHKFLRLSTADFLLGLSKSVISNSLDSFWFLWCVFAATIIVTILRKLEADNFLPLLLVSFFIILFPIEYRNLFFFKFTFPFFCIGYFSATKRDILSQHKFTLIEVLLGLLLSSLCFLSWNSETYIYVSGMKIFDIKSLHFDFYLSKIILFRYIGSFIVSVTFLMLSLLQFRSWRIPFLSELGRNSLAIYILQTFIVERFFSINKAFLNYVNLKLFMSPFLAVSMCLAIYYFAKFLYQYSFISRLFLGTYLNSNTISGAKNSGKSS